MIAHFHTLHFLPDMEILVCGTYDTQDKGIYITLILIDGQLITQEDYSCRISSYDRLTLIESLMRKLHQPR